MKEITPDYLFGAILDSNGIDPNQESEDDEEVMTITSRQILMIAFAGMNATANVLISKGIVSAEEMMKHVAVSIKGIQEAFDFEKE